MNIFIVLVLFNHFPKYLPFLLKHPVYLSNFKNKINSAVAHAISYPTG